MEMFKQLLAVLTHHVSGARCATLRRLGVPVLVMTGPGDLTGDRVVWSSLNGLGNHSQNMSESFSNSSQTMSGILYPDMVFKDSFLGEA